MSYEPSDYYEQLGVPESASEEEIRQAYRTLTRLLHPDRQKDPSLRKAAEAQMRRINGMMETLLDPEKRQTYDESRSEEKPAVVLPFLALKEKIGPYAVKFGPVVAAAVVLTPAAFWFTSGDSIRIEAKKQAIPVQQPKSAANTTRSRKPPQPNTLQPAEAGGARRGEVFPPPVLRSQGAPEGERADALPQAPMAPVPEVDTGSPVAPAVPPPSPFKGLAGTWIYSAGLKREESRVALYSPEFIELKIRTLGSEIEGRYAARYAIGDQAIWPEIRFHFRGRDGGRGGAYEWLGEMGSKGTVDLILTDRGLLEVSWRVTQFGSQALLGAGTAPLIRREEP